MTSNAELDAGAGGDLPAAVLFDMDGLLVRTEPIWFEVERDVMTRLGAKWEPSDQIELLGGSLDWSAAYLVRRSGSGLAPDVVLGWMVDGMERLLRAGPVAWMPGARELLDALRAAGIPTGLVSASYRRLVDAVLAAVGPHRFDVTVAGDEVSAGKPAPEPYLRAARLLEVAPDRCVVLEDSPNGARSALAAGCRTILVPEPHTAGQVAAPDGAVLAPSLLALTPANLLTFGARVLGIDRSMGPESGRVRPGRTSAGAGRPDAP